MNKQAESIVSVLKEQKKTLATAESLTGGLVADAVVSIAGASEVFLGGVVSYTDGVKASLLGVKKETLAAYTAVSAEVAREMADGARRLLGSDCAISTTGLAGPAGGEDGKPVGTVFVGIATPDGTEVFSLHFSGTRTEIRQKTVNFAITSLIKRLTNA